MSEEESANPQLVDFRLEKLEDTIITLTQNLTVMKEIVLKWDAHIQSADVFSQFPLHKEKMNQLEHRLEKVERIVSDLDRLKWKAVGVLSALMLAINLFGGMIAQRFLVEKQNAQVTHTTSDYSFDLLKTNHTNKN